VSDVSAFLRLPLSRPGVLVKCPENPLPTELSQVIVDQPTSHEVTRAAICSASLNWGSDETDGTFTVFVKLAVCVVS
jgi:hypothetical protein